MLYSAEDIKCLEKRWGDKPLVPGSFTREPETGKISGGEELNGGLEGCDTFQQFLTKRLKQIEEIILPKIEQVDKTLDWNKKREEYRTIWKDNAKELFWDTLQKLYDHGLDEYLPVSEHEKKHLHRNISIDLREANCSFAHFEGANCWGAHFNDAVCIRTHFDGAVCYGANFNGVWCKEAHFNYADCRGANFANADCGATHFNGANCWFINFDSADCIYVHFDGAVCRIANFDGANCGDAHFDGTDCTDASFDEKERIDKNNNIVRKPCQLDGVTFKGATFIRVDTRNIDWSKNPRMKRYIEQQQFIESVIGKNWFTRYVFPGGLWWLLADYGRSLFRWFGWACGLILIFAMSFAQHFDKFCYHGIEVSPWTWLYFSVVTFSTLGFGDITPTAAVTQRIVMAEVFTGYVMLGGLITFLANWLGRK